MIIPCKYHGCLKCEQCVHTFHKQCKKFIIAHAKESSREIQPFVYTSKIKVSDRVMWSSNENKAKSLALKYALRINAKVTKYTFSQVISLALSNEPVEASVVYIEYKTKLSGDADKLKGVLTSFIDALILRGAFVSLFISSNITLKVDYTRL